MSFKKNAKELGEEQFEEYRYNFCQMCGTSNAFKLDVHHIYFKSEVPDHPEMHNKRNLIIVCREKCHKALHDKKELRNDLVEERGLKKLFNKL